ncbi:MAG: endonuclease Q family protein [Nanoarchaeota archaeon]|nr:endonuclease Q family protein [Nanoarchaeota archaeon]MBU0978133.1 endonuclease Q family protein [Nanoarchaeota archaeon]
MRIVSDLHVHSKYARACSSQFSIPNLEKWGRVKGLNLIGTGDFQHPKHRKHIDENLKEDEYGILRTKSGFPFIWQTEISLMYSQDKRRAVHHVVLAPSTEIANKITAYLASKGRLDYDGRPIFNIPSNEFVKGLKAISGDIEIIPAHCMTPWFGLFGSKSGFDSLEGCFKDQIKHIYAVESGLSADPPMLWRFKEKFNIVSFSDAHSFWPWRLGREATIFDVPKLTYKNIIQAIRNNNFATIETPPTYGKYHWDGHRNCNFSCSFEQTKKLNSICPKCKQPLTIGVDYRVEEIAQFPVGHKPDNSNSFYEIIPLHEILALYLASGLDTKKTWALYNSLIEKFQNELNILLSVPKEDFQKAELPNQLIELVMLNRKNKLKIQPGYDGEYGKVEMPKKQQTLF